MKINRAARTWASNHYSEIPQTNSLRWKVLFKEEDGSYTPQTGELKCKDFFNDIVAARHGIHFTIYGFTNSEVKTNPEGVYFLLKNIVNMEVFAQNIGSIKDLPGGVELTLEKVDDKSCVCFIPDSVFTSTYSVSVCTYFIRVSNVDTVVTDWAKHPTLVCDNPFSSDFPAIMKHGMTNPKPGFWFYASKEQNSQKPEYKPGTMMASYGNGSTIHNNGGQGVLRAIKMGF